MVKRKIKRITAFICLLIILLSCFGCKASQENQTDTHGDTEYNPVISLKEQDSEAQPYWSNTDNCVKEMADIIIRQGRFIFLTPGSQN